MTPLILRRACSSRVTGSQAAVKKSLNHLFTEGSLLIHQATRKAELALRRSDCRLGRGINSISDLFHLQMDDIASELEKLSSREVESLLVEQLAFANKQMENAAALAKNIMLLAQKLGVAPDTQLQRPIEAVNTSLERSFARERILLLAETVYRSRRERSKYFSKMFFGEPAWDMLIDLFIAQLKGREISTTSLCMASDVPQTTALRYINAMESKGLIERSPSLDDKRRNYVKLSSYTFDNVWQFLEKQSARLFRP
jgi:hypothetical protein